MLLPLLPVVAIGVAVGVCALLDRRVLRWATLGVPVALLICAAWVPARIIRPAYARPATLPAADFGGAQFPVDLTFGESIRLVGYDIGPAETPSSSVRITLYWTAASSLQNDYAVRIALSAGGASVGGFDTYPARGCAPTSTWVPGTVLVDPMVVPIQADAGGRSVEAIISVFHPADGQPLSAVDSEGHFVGTRVQLAAAPVP